MAVHSRTRPVGPARRSPARRPLIVVSTIATLAALFWADPAVSEPLASRVWDGPRPALRVHGYLGKRRLHSDPILRADDTVRLEAFGFAPAERVVIRRLTDPRLELLAVADRGGVVQYAFRVGRVAARVDVVTFVGLAAAPPAAGPGNVVVHVPHASIFPFRPRR